MNGETLRRTVIVRNSQGFHMRPLSSFVELASKFQSNVLVGREGQELVNGKSILTMMGSVMVEMGTPLVLEVHGADAGDAIEALAKFFDDLAVSEP